MFPEGDRMFADRSEAGRMLGDRVAAYLRELSIDERPLVLGLPRGGLPVAAEVAQAVDGDLDLLVSRKIGFPGHAEFGIGAVAEQGPPYFSTDVLRRAGLTERDLAGEVERQRAEVRRRLERYRGQRPPPAVTDRVVVLVDDGLATGVTAHAALASLREQRPRHLMYAAPVCAHDAADSLTEADSVVCGHTADDFGAVGAWYWDFSQTTDEDVVDILTRAWAGGRAG